MSTNQAPARRDLNTLLERVNAASTQLATYLPDGVKPERFMALARRAVAEQPNLAECSSNSVLRAIADCAGSGLPLDGQFSSLIIYKSKQGRPTARWDPSYRGMISLAMSSGFVTDVQSFAVTEHDDFSVELGTEPKIKHVPALLQSGRIVAAYAWARLRSGRLIIEILGRADLDKIKKSSPAGERGPWGAWESQMARKSAVRRLLKKLPASPFRVAMAAAAEPYVMTGTMGAPELERPVNSEHVHNSLPEDEHVLECRALERMNDATDAAQLQAAWAQTQAEYMQAGSRPSQSLNNGYQERADAFAKPPRDPWLDEYDQADGD